MFKLLKYLKRYLFLVCLTILFLFIQAFSELNLPSLMAQIVDTGILKNDMPYILTTGIKMLLVTLIGVGSAAIVGFSASRTASGFARDLRSAVFKSVQEFSVSEFDTFSTSSLITRTTNDITQVQHLIMMGMRMLFFAPVMGFGSIIMALRTGASMSWILIVAVIFVILLIALVFKIAMPKFRIVQSLIDTLNRVSREHLNGLMVIRAFQNEEFEKQRFQKANEDLTRVNLFVNRVMVLMMPTMMLVMNGIGIVIVWVGSHKISQGTMHVGAMMAYLQYAMHAIMSFLMLSMMFIMVPRAAVSADRIAAVLETESSIKDPEHPIEPNADKKGCIEFDSVFFRYTGAEECVLSDISFTITAGQTIGITGPTGCGKSTLINLIPRLNDTNKGSVHVSGVDVKKMSQKKLRDQIGFVPQRAFLRSGTIAQAIAEGNLSASQEDIKEAARIAQIHEFIESIEKDEQIGYDSPVSGGGANFSGGQKQRLSIARALVKKPPIYIFDDSLSALDAQTESKLRHELARATEGSTLIIVSQKIHSLMNADLIFVLDKGRLVGKGSHQELLESCDLYKEIANSQLEGVSV